MGVTTKYVQFYAKCEHPDLLTQNIRETNYIKYAQKKKIHTGERPKKSAILNNTLRSKMVVMIVSEYFFNFVLM